MSDASLARLMWALFEPVHAVTYFAPQPRAAFEEAGLRGFWRGYFAGRAAPLGPVGPAPVVAAFFGFAPAMVARAVPDVWSRATPQAALDARLAGASAALAAALGDDPPGLARAAELLRAAAEAVDLPGRVLGAANAGLPWPDGPLGTLWQAATVLREHRGDGHVAALLTAGLDGCESLVWRVALGGATRAVYRVARGWTEEEWDAAAARLVERGWLTPDGAATDAALAARDEIEATTDRLAGRPWRELGERAAQECAELLGPLARGAATLLPYPNPIGLPQPSPAR
jgi:hypothetical protein